MRRISFTTMMALLVIMAIVSCKKDTRSLDDQLTAAGSLSAPTNATALKLQPGGSSIPFSWSAANAASGGVVLYEVAFDKANGNFSEPVYRVLADGSGVQPQATIPQDTLNKIASLAGIASSSTGTLKWTIMASKAANVQITGGANTIQVTRPAGFAVPPTTLYLTGSGTEAGGTDLSKAIAFKQTSPGVFELYTSLQAGTYQFTDKATDAGTRYYLDASGTVQQGGQTTTVATAGPTRIRLNFNVATSNVVSIQSIGLFMSAYNNEIGQLAYSGNSTWSNARIPVEFFQFSWGRDERYKFVMHTSAGLEYLGSVNVNNVAPSGQPASYFNLLPVTNAQWDNTYKFDPSIDKRNAKVDVYFKANGAYAHTATAVN
jgi:starch-binding outer membrane protein SusE/F